ncbi:hypothetical protein KC318_g3007 [Hortaea werneckii]|nr:hypothetical protein KC334_g3188 [Hortaea werneckii]KAI7019533.1 hypothetical protein KC355_g3014 [Hortaea werneckii]KAI7672210.1 hypothetical protein KC318_g3007 [Hortaea werneckii]
MYTSMETLELTYEGIGKDMTIHRYPRHRRTAAREHVQSPHRRRQAIEQSPEIQLVYRQKPLPHTLMQHRKDTARKTSGLTTLQTGTDRAKEDHTGTDVQQRNIPFVQPTENLHEEKTPPPPPPPPPPPLNLPHRRKPHPFPQLSSARLESTQQQPIPPDLLELAQYINNLPRNPRGRRRSTKLPINNNNNENPTHQTPSTFSSLTSSSESFGAFPSRNMLKRDPKLKGAISRKTGCLLLEKTGARLRKWEGDERVFSKGLWRFLTEEGGSGGS